ncbi:threonine dehydrogenase [Tothia fuscella]|uniref:Threonine dehydrogenase n=1 Tax=Tothia fuscella TaxID=1048955 RepID=A0A9P4NWR5_9PEZI|nr:threonine dehydrogenase [Tothia fuscella]
MKAAQFYGKRDVRVSEVPYPEPKDGQAIVEIEWAGICGSDLHEYIMGAQVIPTKEKPHNFTGASLPITLGHEFCGRIANAPSDSSLQVGQAVMVDPRLYCSSCHPCHAKTTNACEKWGFLGLSGGGGGFSEAVAVDAKLCYPVPQSMLDYAALIEPLTVAWHALKVSGIRSYKGKTALIVGGGPVGIALIYVLKQWAVGRVFVSEPTVKRRAQNKELADEVFDPINQKVGELCRFLTGGKGVDVTFDAAGTPPGLIDGMDALKMRGVYVNVAGWEKPFTVPFIQLMFKEISIVGSRAYDDEDFRETVDAFVKGDFKGCERMITSRINLEDITEKGFENLIERKDEHIKIMVTPKIR